MITDLYITSTIIAFICVLTANNLNGDIPIKDWYLAFIPFLNTLIAAFLIVVTIDCIFYYIQEYFKGVK